MVGEGVLHHLLGKFCNHRLFTLQSMEAHLVPYRCLSSLSHRLEAMAGQAAGAASGSAGTYDSQQSIIFIGMYVAVPCRTH